MPEVGATFRLRYQWLPLAPHGTVPYLDAAASDQLGATFFLP